MLFFIPYGTREKGPKRKFPIVTALLVLINIAVFALEASVLFNYGDAGLSALFGNFAAIPADLTDGTPFEVGLFTAMFLHGSLLHIISNMIFLMPFGDNVEDRLGRFRYLLFYIACGLIATIIYTLFNAGSTIPLVGASGAIAGVLAGYLALFPKGVVKGFLLILIIFFRVDLPAFVFIGFWFITQVVSSFASIGNVAAAESGGVAFLAHVGGFLAGLVLAPLMAKPQREIPQAWNYR